MGRRGLAFSPLYAGEPLVYCLSCSGTGMTLFTSLRPSCSNVDDLKSRPDLVVARLAGQKKQHEITHDNRQDLDAAASGQNAHGNQDEGRQPCVNLSLTKAPWHFSGSYQPGRGDAEATHAPRWELR